MYISTNGALQDRNLLNLFVSKFPKFIWPWNPVSEEHVRAWELLFEENFRKYYSTNSILSSWKLYCMNYTLLPLVILHHLPYSMFFFFFPLPCFFWCPSSLGCNCKWLKILVTPHPQPHCITDILIGWSSEYQKIFKTCPKGVIY